MQAFLDELDPDAPLCQHLDKAPQVVQISRQAIHAVHNNRIALTGEGKERLELRALGVLARGFVSKDLIGPSSRNGNRSTLRRISPIVQCNLTNIFNNMLPL